jgi:hypothetical protein
VAGAAQPLTSALDTVAGGLLPGASPSADPTGAAAPQQQSGVKGQSPPSGLNPPETPITLPTAPTTDANTDLGDVITGGSHYGGSTGNGTGNGTGTGDNSNSGGGKGGKHHVQVDLAPVTDTVDQVVTGVVTGVVEGVTGILNGLTGNTGN